MGQFITPDSIPSDTFCRRILIPNDPKWIGAVSGALMILMYPSEWSQIEGISAEDAAERAKQMLYEYWNSECCGDDCMNCCEDRAITKRINPESGRVEQSTDGGTTWTPAPGGLESVIVQPVPPVTSGVAATKCDAATNVAGQVDVWIDQVSNDFTTAVSLLEFGLAVLEAILIAVVTIVSAGTLTALELAVLPTIAAALFAAWGAGKTVFDDYWTTDIKDKILCAVYCHIGEDGSFTAAQFSATWNEINGQLPPSPAKMLFMGFLSSVGVAGLNAMAATGMSADADCDDCTACLPCNQKWHVFGDVPTHGTITATTDDYVEVLGGLPGNGNCYAMIRTANKDTCCAVDHIEVIGDVGATSHVQGWTDCGVEPVEGAPQHVGLGWGTCINYFHFQSDAQFTVRVYFVDCP